MKSLINWLKVGSQMMKWIYQFAKDNECIASELNCYVKNEEAHRFWEKEEYKIITLHFQKTF